MLWEKLRSLAPKTRFPSLRGFMSVHTHSFRERGLGNLKLGFPGGSVVKNPPATEKTWVESLGWEDPLEKEQQPTPVFLPGKPHGRRSLADYSPRGRREPDTGD